MTAEIESFKRKLREVTEEKEKVEKLYHVLEMKVNNSDPELERKCRELSQTISVLEQKLSWGITENERLSLASEEKLENMLKIKVMMFELINPSKLFWLLKDEEIEALNIRYNRLEMEMRKELETIASSHFIVYTY